MNDAIYRALFSKARDIILENPVWYFFEDRDDCFDWAYWGSPNTWIVYKVKQFKMVWSWKAHETEWAFTIKCTKYKRKNMFEPIPHSTSSSYLPGCVSSHHIPFFPHFFLKSQAVLFRKAPFLLLCSLNARTTWLCCPRSHFFSTSHKISLTSVKYRCCLYIRNVTWRFCPYTVTRIHTPVVRDLGFTNRTYIPEKTQTPFHISCWSSSNSNYVASSFPVIEFMSTKKTKYIANLATRCINRLLIGVADNLYNQHLVFHSIPK